MTFEPITLEQAIQAREDIPEDHPIIKILRDSDLDGFRVEHGRFWEDFDKKYNEYMLSEERAGLERKYFTPIIGELDKLKEFELTPATYISIYEALFELLSGHPRADEEYSEADTSTFRGLLDLIAMTYVTRCIPDDGERKYILEMVMFLNSYSQRMQAQNRPLEKYNLEKLGKIVSPDKSWYREYQTRADRLRDLFYIGLNTNLRSSFWNFTIRDGVGWMTIYAQKRRQTNDSDQ